MKNIIKIIVGLVLLSVFYYVLKEYASKDGLITMIIIETGLLYSLFMERINKM